MSKKPILLLLGGSYHDFAGFADLVSPLLEQHGYQVEAGYDCEALLSLKDSQVERVMLYTCFGVAPAGETPPAGFNAAQTAALSEWVQAGGGLLALHATTVSGQTNEPLKTLLGGAFISHPPQFNFTVYPMAAAHPLTEEIEAFTVHDEFYVQDYDPGVSVHLVATDRGVSHPMMWSKQIDQGRLVHLALGHGPRTWNLPAYQRLLVQALAWLGDTN